MPNYRNTDRENVMSQHESKNRMKIELLIFEGCPNHKFAEEILRESVKALGIIADIEIIYVADNDDAVVKRFLGSPSIRINGKDIEIEENAETQYSMRCRRYKKGDIFEGFPGRDLIKRKLLLFIGDLKC